MLLHFSVTTITVSPQIFLAGCYSGATGSQLTTHSGQLVEELQNLSAALESERYRFKNLNKFRDKTEVQESLQRITGLLASLGDEADAQQGALGDAEKQRA